MEDNLSMISVPAIVTVVYWIVALIKYTTNNNEKVLRLCPIIAAGLGIACGVIAFYAIPDIMPTDNIFVAILIGGASGLSATGFNQIIKQAQKAKEDKQ